MRHAECVLLRLPQLPVLVPWGTHQVTLLRAEWDLVDIGFVELILSNDPWLVFVVPFPGDRLAFWPFDDDCNVFVLAWESYRLDRFLACGLSLTHIDVNLLSLEILQVIKTDECWKVSSMSLAHSQESVIGTKRHCCHINDCVGLFQESHSVGLYVSDSDVAAHRVNQLWLVALIQKSYGVRDILASHIEIGTKRVSVQVIELTRNRAWLALFASFLQASPAWFRLPLPCSKDKNKFNLRFNYQGFWGFGFLGFWGFGVLGS